MSIRIFKVEYWISEKYDGKPMNDYKQTMNVAATNASEAIAKVQTKATKASSFNSEDENGKATGKKVKVSYYNFDPINVTLEAEAE